MRRLTPLVAFCLLSACTSSGGGDDETGRKYVVFFNTGSSQVDQPGNVVVTNVAAIAQRHPDLALVVAGYAAAHGNLNADAQISAARADSVARALQADGVAAARITEHARPPANEDPSVAARRVEIGFAPRS